MFSVGLSGGGMLCDVQLLLSKYCTVVDEEWEDVCCV